ncbi:hypothetical protein FHT86_001050 [Rhizobium sp. BK313]|uniref:hypothetical protein n=1 Tax=Rhizobium sp. BK313 TaxID=2587081 RepID=UPI001815A514|nr:hypothetical protein [Rhizobium sp. BK313]
MLFRVAYDSAVAVIPAESPIVNAAAYSSFSGIMDFLLTALISVSLLTGIIKRFAKAAAGRPPKPTRDGAPPYQAEQCDDHAPDDTLAKPFDENSAVAG